MLPQTDEEKQIIKSQSETEATTDDAMKPDVKIEQERTDEVAVKKEQPNKDAVSVPYFFLHLSLNDRNDRRFVCGPPTLITKYLYMRSAENFMLRK